MRKRKVREYDDETGEFYFEKEYIVKNDDGKMVLIAKNRRFSKIFHNVKAEFSTVKYLGYFYKLLLLLEKNSNRIVFHKEGINLALDRKMVADYLGVARTTAWRFICEATRKGYITRAEMHSEREAFYVNPVFAMNGVGCYPETYLLFEGEKEIEKQICKDDRDKINSYFAVRKK